MKCVSVGLIQHHTWSIVLLHLTLFYLCLHLPLLSLDVEASKVTQQKPRGFIPTLEGHWTFLNINCDGEVQDNNTISTELIRHHDGLLDNLLPKKNKKKRKKKKKKSRDTRSASNFEETLNNLHHNGQPKREEERSFFGSKLFGDSVEIIYSDSNPKIKPLNIIPQSEKNASKVNFHENLSLTLTEVAIGGSKYIHLNVNCPETFLNNNVINASVSHLIVSSDGALFIGNDSLQTEGDLSYLKLWSSGGLAFPPSCSWVPPTVEILDLSHSILQHGNFTDCMAPLKTLSIAGASLHSLQICLPTLRSLDASWNNLEEFIQECPRGADAVLELDLSQNILKSWSSCGWPNVTHVNLVYNEITQLDLDTCVSHSLVDLKVANNKLIKMPSYTPPSLINLDLRYNFLKKMQAVEGSLQTLLLSHNELTHLGKSPFQFAWQLFTLDLSYNGLTTLYGHYFKGLRELRSLDVSYNNLQDIKHEAFRPLRRLRRLSLEGNKLSQLDQRLMANLPKGLEFNAYDNPWGCSCHLLKALRNASRVHCGPSCHKPKLQCQEGNVKWDIQDILEECQLSFDRVISWEVSHGKHPEIDSSDEDISEEIKSQDLPLILIPGVILIVLVPVIIAVSRNIYVKRNKIREKWCNCLEPNRPEAASHSLSPWRSNPNHRINKDSDSETEI